MADSNVTITQGSGANIDTRTETTNSNHRQVVVVGDPSVNDAVAEVVSVPPGTAATNYGQVVRVAGSVQIGGFSGSAFLTGVYNSIGVYFDRGNPNVLTNYGSGTFVVGFDSSRGFLQGINSSVAIYFDRGNPNVIVSNLENTGIIYRNAAGSTSTAGNTTVVGPESGRNIKIYAYQLTTTAQVGLVARFTTGASAGATEIGGRAALQAPSQGIAGTNRQVTPPSYLFATGTGNTLALYIDTGSLIHYDVSYFKESA